MEMRVLEEGGSYVEIALIGALDFTTASDSSPLLRELTRRGVPVILDVSKLSYMSSMAIGLLLKAQQALARAGGMVLLSPPPDIAQVLHSTRLQRVIPIENLKLDALRRLGVQPPSPR
jgi:anti-anti-sigma factor